MSEAETSTDQFIPPAEFAKLLNDLADLNVDDRTEEVLREANRRIEQLETVFEAAYGLCMGYDWNNGTAAIRAGYKRKLLSAVNAIKPVPDFEGKYRSAGN